MKAINNFFKDKTLLRRNRLTFVLSLIFILFNENANAQNISAPDTINIGTSFQVSHNISNAASQLWQFGDGNSSIISNPSHSYQNSSCGYSSYLIQLTITDSNSNISNYSKTITVKNYTPTPNLMDVDMFTPFSNCDNSPSLSNPNFTINLQNLTLDTVLVSYYLVNWGDNSGVDTIINNSFPISHTYQSLGLFQFNITAVNHFGCTQSNQYQIANQSNPAVGLSSLGSTQGCAPQEFTFILSQYLSNSPGTYYIWNFGDGSPNITWSYNDPYNNDSIKHIFQTTSCQNGGLAFTVSVTAYNYCDQTTATVSNIRIYTSPVAQFTSSSDTSCVNNSINFNNNTLSGFGYNCNGNANYLWDFGDGSVSNITNAQHNYLLPGTYTIQLTASNGVCGTSTDSTVVIINELPFASANLSSQKACDSVIVNTTNQSTGGNLKYNWTISPQTGWVLLGNSNLADDNINIKFFNKGIYTINLNALNNCGQDDTSFQITVMGKPEVNIFSINDFCDQAIVQPNASIDSNFSIINNYNWIFSNGIPSVSNVLNPGNINFQNIGNQQIILSATNYCGTGFDTTNFTIHSLPNVSASSLNPIICLNDTSSLIASGASNYQWFNNNGNPFSTTAATNVTPSNSTLYFVVGQDSNQCTNTDSISITVNNLPIVSINNANPTICLGDTIHLSGNGAQNYNWIINGSIIGSNSNISINPSQSNQVILIGTDANNCSSIDSSSFQVYNRPIISISNTPAICQGDSILVQIGGASNIQLSPFLSQSGGIYTLKPNSSTNYQITGYDLTGCNTDTGFSLTVNPLPQIIAIQSDTNICFGDSINFAALGGNNYEWYSNSNLISNQNNFNWNPTTTGNIILKGQDLNGCISTDTSDFQIYNLPNIQISAINTNICEGDSFKLFAAGGLNYQWLINNQILSFNSWFSDTISNSTTFNLIGYDSFGCSNSDSITVSAIPLPQLSIQSNSNQICFGDSIQIQLNGGLNYSVDGIQCSNTVFLKPNATKNFEFIAISANNCTDTINYNLTVNSLPIITASSSQQSICLGLSTQLNAGGGQSYIWSPSQSLANATATSTIATPNQTTKYFVEGTDQNGCKNSDSIIINVSSVLNIQVSASKQSICNGDSVQLTASGANSYQWAAGNGLLSSIGDTVSALPSNSTSFIVTGTDTMGCISTKSIAITVHQLPNIGISSSVNAVCPGDSVSLNVTGATTYLWTITDSTQVNTASGSSLIYFPISSTIFTVIGQDANQCESSQSISIGVYDKPNIMAFSNKTAICQGESVILSSTGGQSLHWIQNGNISQPNSANTSASPNQNQWFHVIGQSINNCINEDSVYVTVMPTPSISSINTNMSICSGDSANLSVIGIGQINWLPTTGLSSSNGNSINASPINNTAYTAILTDSNGCTNNTIIQLDVNSLPVANFTTDSLVCKNSIVNFTNQSTNTINYNWNFGDLSNSNSQNPSHNYNQTGYFETTLIAYSSANCTDSIKKVIHVIEAPQANFSSFPQSGCAPLSLNLNNSSQSYAGNYFWTFGNGQTSSTLNPNGIIYNSQPGHDTTYIINLSTSNICGTSTFSDTINVLTKPVANFGFNLSSLCSPSIASFGNISSSNTTSFFWDLGDTTYSNLPTPSSHSYFADSLATDFHINLIAINSCGADTMHKVLHLNPNYVQSVFTPSTIQACAPAHIQFSNFSNIQTMANWTFGDGNFSSQINPSHTYNNAGTYNVSLVVTDNCGIDTATTTIIIGNPPIINFSLSQDTICQYGSSTLTNLTPNLTNLIWNFGDSSSSNLSTISHQYNQAGQYNITLIGEDLTSHCTDTAIGTIHINPSASAEITVNDPDGCYPLNINFQNTSSGATYYQWDFDNGNTSANINPSHNFVNPGTYNVQLIADNFYGCSDTTYTIIKAYPKPTAAFSIINQSPCSFPAIIEFVNNSTGASGYQWDFNNNDSSQYKNPINQYLNPGIYSPKLIAYNIYQCTDTVINTLNLSPIPTANYEINNQSGCEGLDVQFNNKSQNSNSYQWIFGNGNTSNLANPLTIYNNAGFYHPTLIATNLEGCSDSLTLIDTIKIYPNPKIDFLIENIDINQEERGKYLFTNLTTHADNYQWDFGDGEYSNDINPIHQFYDHGEFSIELYATNNYGCSNTNTKNLSVNMLNGLYVPTALAPNNPNPELKQFAPKGRGLASYHLAVYDSWGKLLWETSRIQDGEPVESWNGTDSEGVSLPQGVYFWLAEAVFEDGTIWKGMTLPTGDIVTKGTVTIVR